MPRQGDKRLVEIGNFHQMLNHQQQQNYMKDYMTNLQSNQSQSIFEMQNNSLREDSFTKSMKKK
jgi:hypothetical protein